MPENIMNSAQKSNSKEFNDNYDRIFGPKFNPNVFDCAEYGCGDCPMGEECRDYLNKKFELNL